MKLSKAFLLAACILNVWLTSVSAQIYDFTTIAGTAGTSGSTNGLGTVALFNYPASVVVTGNSSNIYVADYGNHRIQKISKAGTHIASFPTKQNPRGVIVTSDNKIIVTDDSIHTITIYNEDGTTMLLQLGSYGSNDAQFEDPNYICLNSKGHLIVSDEDNHRIQVFQ